MQLTPRIAEELRPISSSCSPMDPKFHVKHIALGYLSGNNVKQLFAPLDSARCVVAIGAHPPPHLEIVDRGVQIVDHAGRNQLPSARQPLLNDTAHFRVTALAVWSNASRSCTMKSSRQHPGSRSERCRSSRVNTLWIS